jgi:putative ABC transport system permease protein
VRDAQYVHAGEPRVSFLYTDYWQQEMTSSWPEDSRTLIRVQGDPSAMLPELRRVVTGIDPDVPISEDMPLGAWLAWQFQAVRVATTFLSCFGALALLLSAIGLYGLLAFLVGRRTREIGIRMALGAGRSTVAGAVLRQGAARVMLGGVIGVAIAAGCARLLEKLLYGVTRFDAISFVAGPAILALVGLAACVIPAHRAMRVDPMVALRHE